MPRVETIAVGRRGKFEAQIYNPNGTCWWYRVVNVETGREVLDKTGPRSARLAARKARKQLRSLPTPIKENVPQ